MLLCAGRNDRIGGEIESKYRWETFDVIPLLPLVWINHRRPILHKSKRMVHLYSDNDLINQFSVGYMINTSLHVNKVFIEQVENS